MNRKIIWIVAALGLLGSPAFAQQENAPTDDTEQYLAEQTAKLQDYLKRTKSLTATFDSVLLDAGQRESDTSTGTVYIKRPGKFRWEYQTPYPSIVLADGERLWSYDEELEQAVVRKLSDYRGANPTLLLGGDANVTDSFTVEKSYATPEVNWLELIPKDDTSDFVKVRLGFRDEVIYLMELFDRLEQTTRIRFTDVSTNVEIEDAMFVFEPPENVDVVGAED